MKVFNAFLCALALAFTLTQSLFAQENQTNAQNTQTVLSYEEVHAQISAITDAQQIAIDADFESATDLELLNYFIHIGGDGEKAEELINFYEQKASELDTYIKERFSPTELSERDEPVLYRMADEILQRMHKMFFKNYYKNSFTMGDIKARGLYDCVSASVLYGILCRRYNIKFVPIETPDHVLVKIVLPSKEVDVETTNYYGFDPGTKKEFQSNFTKSTGFTYVSPVNYKRRYNIELKQLFGFVAQNWVSVLITRKDYLKAAQFGYLLTKVYPSEKSTSSFNSAMNNLSSSMVSANNKIARFDESYRWISDLPDSQNKRALVNNTYLAIVQNANKTGNYKTGYKNLENSFNYNIPKISTEYVRFRLMLTNNTCINLMDGRKYDEARALIDNELGVGALGKSDLNKMYRSICTKEANQFYNEKRYKEAIILTLDCLERMPADKVLINNLKVYYKDYVLYLKDADPKEARAVLAEAKKRFPSEKAFEALGIDTKDFR